MKPSLEQSPHMHGIPFIGNYPPKHNKNACDVGIKFSRQIGDHIVKGPPSSGCHFNNTRVCKKEYALQKSLVDATEKGFKVFVDSIDHIQVINLQFEK